MPPGAEGILDRVEVEGAEAAVIARPDLDDLALRRVIARGRDYTPDSGRFDVSAPGTPFSSPDHAVNLDLVTHATRRRQV